MHDDWERASGSEGTQGIPAPELRSKNEAKGRRMEIDINEVRRDEERAAMRLLNLEPVWLDLPDAPYRRGLDGRYLYASNPELLGSVAREERRTLVPWIAGQISRVAFESGAHGRVRVFAPLGVGRHVDHQLAFLAARRLGPRYGVLFYEDYPYAARPGALQARIGELRVPMQPRITPITDLIGVKIAAIARYKSQLGGLFDSVENMPTTVRAYSQAVAASAGITSVQYAERAWFIPPSYRLG